MSAGGVATTGARLLLRRLRSLMAEGGSAEQRLQQIVRTIAADMVAEVCSAYVMRPGEVLELFATEGLKAEAIHRTRLRVDGITAAVNGITVSRVAPSALSLGRRDNDVDETADPSGPMAVRHPPSKSAITASTVPVAR